MNSTLKKLLDVKSDCCVTILLETHRTPPGNQKDEIELKNLVKEAETRVSSECDKELASIIIDKINQVASEINYRYNLEGLALFVNENIAEYIRIPIKLENRVIIDKKFATRSLIRAFHEELDYYILVLSHNKARLIEAVGDKEITEIRDGFPKENTFVVPNAEGSGSARTLENGSDTDFFNDLDKQLNQLQKGIDLPVFICAEESTYADFLKVANRPKTIAGFVNGNMESEDAHNIIDKAWPVAKKWNEEKNHQRLTELSAAIGAKNFLTDYTEIWRAIGEGRGRTLFVKKGLFQPANLKNNVVTLVSSENAAEANVDDIIGEMIEKNLEFDGDTVFISGEELDKYDGLVLVTRY